MSLTKVTYSMIKGAVVNVFDFMTEAQIASVQARDGLVDVTAPIQAAINSIVIPSYVERPGQIKTDVKVGTVFFPAGEYVVSNTLELVEAFGVVLQGAGEGGSRITWKGTGGSVIKFADTKKCQLNNFDLFVDPAFSCDEVVLILQDNALVKVTPSANQLNDLNIRGNGVATNGVVVNYTSADANNDFHEINSCNIEGYLNAGCYFFGLQAHCLYLTNVGFLGANSDFTGNLGQHGIEVASAISTNAPSVIYDGGGCGWHADSDFKLNGVGANGFQAKNISGENSNRLLTTSVSGSSTHIILENYRYSSENLAADGYFIKNETGSKLICIGCEFGSNGITNPAQPKVFLSSNTSIVANFINCSFRYAELGTGVNSTQYSPVYVEPTAAEYATADIRMTGCVFTNIYRTTQRSFLVKSGVPAATISLDSYYGDTFMLLGYTGATSIETINAAYPNQEIVLIVTQPNITIKHNAGGVGQIRLKSGADFTATIFPTSIKLKYVAFQDTWADM